MAEKSVFEVRMDADLYKKMEVVSESSGQNINNYLLSLVRTNIAYYERVHGKVNVSSVSSEVRK